VIPVATNALEVRRSARPALAWSGLAPAVASAAAFGLSGSLATSLLQVGWSPAAVVAARIGGAFGVLAVPCLLLLRRIGLPSGRQAWRLAAYGVVAVAVAQLCYFSAVQYLSVGVALLLEYTAPVLLIGWRWAGTRRRPAAAMLAGAALAVGGLVLVLNPGQDLRLSPVGVAWGLGAAICLCGYFLLSEERSGEEPLPSLLLTTAGTGIGAVVVLVVGLVGVFPLRTSTAPAVLAGHAVAWWLPVGLLVGVSAVFAYLTGIAAVRRLGSSLASFVALAEVIFAVVFAVVLLGQRPSMTQAFGGLLVLAGIAAVQRGETRRQRD
jgi:drug/metabolite transporter (DMT)-like permease